MLNDNRIIHRDIKPENILLHNSKIIKIIDFGFCRKVEEDECSSPLGTCEYKAPEVGRGKYGFKSDVYSLGCVLYELLYGRCLFDSTSNRRKSITFWNDVTISEEMKKII